MKDRYRIFVTTVGTASNQGRVFNQAFTRVLMDEATMIKETDALWPLKDAQQLVMIGD